MMLLEKLIKNMPVELIKGNIDIEILGSCVNSQKAKKGFIFFAMKGQQREGASFINDAISRGASAIITDSKKSIELENMSNQIPIFYCENIRDVMGIINLNLYGNPSSVLDLVGITGTNGKTTTVFLLEHILKNDSRCPGIISTVKYSFASRSIPSEMTTPDNPELFDLLSQMVKAGCDISILEISSQASHQKRIAGIDFDLKIFTNLSQDHLDYHKNMQNYKESKESFLFDDKKVPVIINKDDDFGKYLYEKYRSSFNITTYSVYAESDFKVLLTEKKINKEEFRVQTPSGEYVIQTPLKGLFNTYNILAALSAAYVLKLDLSTTCEAIKTFIPPEGRLTEITDNEGRNIFIDYAHTPEALKNVLETLRVYAKKRLILCFGCGGERDSEKRAAMGKIASLNADVVFITNDNPRKEDPDAIIDEIAKGFIKKNFKIIKDRREAIQAALLSMEKNDLLIIAGKGHENYQIIGSQYIPFNDIEVVKELCGKD
ncbi:MAG: UDP-N-acetylmuramoyl-L-alanyl-D-glutamate--2,6-diaminopimelate ligase [Candidatus Aureabacteria bacterium]|nr:UDP-N-acetylmuramoyl-L-alanyl-D-glutamate--2,6-diaminopimelate ligase [Candidatus Auribacterota bacterium]